MKENSFKEILKEEWQDFKETFKPEKQTMARTVILFGVITVILTPFFSLAFLLAPNKQLETQCPEGCTKITIEQPISQGEPNGLIP